MARCGGPLAAGRRLRRCRVGKKIRLSTRLSLDELRRKDAELAKIARLKPAMMVALAECLASFKERKWHWEMGAGQFKDFVAQWCRQSSSWGDQHARLGLRLRELPKLKAAILCGAVPISHAMKLAGIVEGEDEEEWVADLRGRSATAVAELLRVEPEPGEKDEAGDDEDEDYVTWSCKASPYQLAWMRAAFILIEAVAGTKLSRDELAEAVIAEVLTTLLYFLPAEGGGFDVERQAAIDEARRLNRITRYDAERRADASLPRPEWIEPVEIRVPSDLRGALRLLQVLCKRLDGLDLEVGLLAADVWASNGWKRLGYASEQQYCERRIGMSLRSVRAKRALARTCLNLEAVARALRAGHIGYVQATLICRVASRATARLWVRRAKQRTVKHLREEVDAAEALGIRRPPTQKQLATVVGLEQAVHGLPDPGAQPPRQLSAALTTQSGVFEWRMRRSQRDRMHGLMQMYAKWGSPYADFIDFVPIAIFSSQVLDPERIKSDFYDIGQRDLGCTNPVCTNKDCSGHHIQFRSHGGTDDGWNLTGADTTCHLNLIHVLRSLRVTGRAPAELHWELGPRDIGLEVIGRKLLHPKRAA